MNEQTLVRKVRDWENQLLDLGRRNRMIAYRENRRSTLALQQPGFEGLFRRLVTEGEALTFQQPLDRDTDGRTWALLQLMEDLGAPMQVMMGDIGVPGDAEETRRTLKNLRDKARLAQSEQGVNALYLTFGFVLWHEKDRADAPLRSPLLLVPVTLTLSGINAPYTLRRHEEDIVVNPTLAYLFQRDYGVQLPEFDGDEDSLTDYIARVEALLDEHGWQVERACSLGLLSFQKISMYHDLVRHEAQLLENPIIRAFAGEKNPVSAPDLTRISMDHDGRKALDQHQVLMADSSQQDAIVLSREGVSFVMQGPPGTGKSQTIANIIAQALADGKRILFVSEKAAALDVVLRRLTDARLDDFCLALHSHKANKKAVLAQLEQNLDLARCRVREDDIDALARLDILREQLLAYVQQAHEEVMPLGRSFYEAAGILAEGEDVPEVSYPLPDVMQADREQLMRHTMLLASADQACHALGEAGRQSPWRAWQGSAADAAALRALRQCVQEAVQHLSRLEDLTLAGTPFLAALSAQELTAFAPVYAHALACARLPEAWFQRDTRTERECIRQLQQLAERMASLTGAMPEGLAASDVDAERMSRDLETGMQQLKNLLPGEDAEAICGRLSDIKAALDGLMEAEKRIAGALNGLEKRWSVSFKDGEAAVCHALTLCRVMAKPWDGAAWVAGRSVPEGMAALREDVQRVCREKETLRLRYGEDGPILPEAPALLAQMEQAIREAPFLADMPDLASLHAAGACTEAALVPVYDALSAKAAEAFRACGMMLPVTLDGAACQQQALLTLPGMALPEAWQSAEGRRAAAALLDGAAASLKAVQTLDGRVREALHRAGIRTEAALTAEQTEALLHAQRGIGEAEHIVRQEREAAAFDLLDEIDVHAAAQAGHTAAIRTFRQTYRVSADVEDSRLLTLLAPADGPMPSEAPEWWVGERERALDLLHRLQEKTDALQAIRRELAVNWTDAVYALDHEGLKQRFEGRYTSIFKHLDPGYRQDVRQVQLAARRVSRRPTDGQVRQLLDALQRYHQLWAAYQAMAPQAKRLLGVDRLTLEDAWAQRLQQAEAFTRASGVFAVPEDARRALEDGAWQAVLADLRQAAAELRWFAARKPEGQQRFGVLYQEGQTDTSALREALECASILRPMCASEERLAAILAGRAPDLSAVAEELQALLGKQHFLLESREALLTGTNGQEIDLPALEQARSRLQSWTDAVQAIGEEAALHLVRRGAALPRETGACLQTLSAVLALREKAALVRLEEAGTLPLPALMNAIIQRAEQARRLECLLAPVARLADKSVSLSPNDILADLQALCRMQRVREALNALEQSGWLDRAERNDPAALDERLALLEALHGLLAGPLSPALAEELRAGRPPFKEAEAQTLRSALADAQRIRHAFPDLADAAPAAGAAETVQRILADVSALAGQQCGYTAAVTGLQTLANLQEMRSRFDAALRRMQAIMPETPLSAGTDWAEALRLFDHLEALKAARRTKALPDVLLDWLTHRLPDAVENADVQALLRDRESLAGLLQGFAAPGLEQRPLCELLPFLRRCEADLPLLDGCLLLRERRRACADAGLEAFVIQAEGRAEAAFLKAFYTAWVRALGQEKEALASFRATLHTEAVEAFCALDDHQTVVAQARIREQLIRSMPVRTTAAHASDELSILEHEMGKRRNLMPLRKLFRSIPNLLLRLKPCLMMSPLSVAHFLEADTYRFDLVIFDEASQIFPQDAIGAILRGKQVIIAGDSKQLPPTNFFAAGAAAEEEADDEEDFLLYDSILEEAAACLPSQSLLWHYRSRHEALIAFSNQEIYGRRLVTFPGSTTARRDTGLEYIHVPDGVYADRCNVQEANRIVELVAEHIARHPERSLGVIAFSERQQHAIEQALTAWRLTHPQHEPFFAEEKDEPFFVKNLENVQGDERDTIIFSVCYGRNSQGRMYMRFGPLGQQGGERRLNVAITRARENIKLVGSILPEDIDLNKTNAEGVRMLRDYIRFAMQGASALRRPEGSSREDGLMRTVAACLQDAGYQVETNVGASACTVDIAVMHRERPGCYLAGVVCDGAAYRDARTVRDRDHLRPAQLRRMHWRMYRVWSAAWLRDPEGEKARLLRFLEEAGRDEAPPEERPSAEVEDVLTETEAAPAVPQEGYGIPLYRAFTWQDAAGRFSFVTTEDLPAAIRAVLAVEQPIHQDLLLRRLADMMDLPRITPRLREDAAAALSGPLHAEVQQENGFLRLADCAPVVLRRSLPGRADRTIDHISRDEIAGAMVCILQNAIGIAEAEWLNETAAVFGFERMGPRIRLRVQEAAGMLREQGRITLLDGKVTLNQ